MTFSQVMGSEGYLINQFIAEHTNKRKDEWGGSYENRIRLPLEIVKRIRSKVQEIVLVFSSTHLMSPDIGRCLMKMMSDDYDDVT